MSNEVAVKQSQEVAVSAAVDSFAESGFTAKDISIHKIVLMQGLSALVGEGKFKMCDLVDFTDKTLFANSEVGMDIIPVHAVKTWGIYAPIAGSTKRQWVRSEPRTAVNENLPWTFIENGQSFQRDAQMTLFFVRKDEAAAGTAIPFSVTLSRMSMKTAEAFATCVLRLKMAKLPMWARSFKLMSRRDQNKKNNAYYAVFAMTMGGETTAEEREQASFWFESIKAMKNLNITDDEPEHQETPAHTPDRPAIVISGSKQDDVY